MLVLVTAESLLDRALSLDGSLESHTSLCMFRECVAHRLYDGIFHFHSFEAGSHMVQAALKLAS